MSLSVPKVVREDVKHFNVLLGDTLKLFVIMTIDFP